jgi:cyanuric acid amidohydrolase
MLTGSYRCRVYVLCEWTPHLAAAHPQEPLIASSQRVQSFSLQHHHHHQQQHLRSLQEEVTMPPITLHKYPTTSPSDTSPLTNLVSTGTPASSILACIGKTEGNGLVNDFSRTLASHIYSPPALPENAVTVFSGGTEGVLSPHVTFVVEGKDKTGLLGAVGRTGVVGAGELGRKEHAVLVREVVEGLMGEMGVGSEHVKLVLVKCPLLSGVKIAALRESGQALVAEGSYESMGCSRFAAAVGVAAALGELEGGDAGIKAALEGRSTAEGEGRAFSARASCSSGAELEDNHIFVLAEDPSVAKTGPGMGLLRAVSRPMRDAIDAGPILDILEQVRREGGELVQVFAKAEADPKGLIRGKRHTMETDSDVHSTRHARAAVGGLLAGLTGDTAIYVSGGAEGQGVDGGGSLCVVYRVP